MSSRKLSEEDMVVISGVLGEELASEFKTFLDSRRDDIEDEAKKTGEEKVKVFKVNTKNFIILLDLVGYSKVDEERIDEAKYTEPLWMRDLRWFCEKNPNEVYRVIFTGTNECCESVYNRLQEFKKNGVLSKNIVLPPNAEYGDFELAERDFAKEREDAKKNHHWYGRFCGEDVDVWR